jgi:hypothetical protein
MDNDAPLYHRLSHTIENQHFIRDGVMGKAFVSHETAPVRLLGANCYDWLL